MSEDLNNLVRTDRDDILTGFFILIFFSGQNFCSMLKPCLNNAKCLYGYTDKKYLCVCASGFTGENCENGNMHLAGTIYMRHCHFYLFLSLI